MKPQDGVNSLMTGDFGWTAPQLEAMKAMGTAKLSMEAWLGEDSPMENLHLNGIDHLAWQKAGNSKQRVTLCL